jgi:oxygen-dependent protoporphyrinogen oxidase
MGVPFDVAAARASGLLSAASLSAIDVEPTRPGLPPLAGDIGVGELVRDRLGDEVVDRLVEPLLAGVYAGRADRISLRAALPALAAQLRDGGSLVAAARAATGDGARDSAAGSTFAAITGGVGRLPMALAASGRFIVRTGVTVRSIRRTPEGFALDCGPVPRSESVAADAAIVAVPPAKAAPQNQGLQIQIQVQQVGGGGIMVGGCCGGICCGNIPPVGCIKPCQYELTGARLKISLIPAAPESGPTDGFAKSVSGFNPVINPS